MSFPTTDFNFNHTKFHLNPSSSSEAKIFKTLTSKFAKNRRLQEPLIAHLPYSCQEKDYILAGEVDSVKDPPKDLSNKVWSQFTSSSTTVVKFP